MIVDGAGWHRSKTLKLPENLKFHFLPPYSPQLNPQENIWEELREKFFHNKAFESMQALENELSAALFSLENNHELIKSITAWDWIINSIPINLVIVPKFSLYFFQHRSLLKWRLLTYQQY